jgi:hypothetical protein
LELGIGQAVGLKRLSGVFDPDELIELQLHRRPARKVDAEVGLATGDLDQCHDAQYHHDAGKQKRITALAHEIHIGLPENF